MDIIEAMRIFGYSGIDQITEQNIKKTYRVLMRQNHPDIGGDTETAKKINDAHSTLNDSLKKLEAFNALVNSTAKNQEIPCILGFMDYINLYSGTQMDVVYNNETHRLNARTLNKFRCLLDTNITVRCNGESQNLSRLFALNSSDVYQFNATVNVSSLDDKLDITVFGYGKSKSITVEGSNVILVLDYEYNIKIKVRIERRLVENADNR